MLAIEWDSEHGWMAPNIRPYQDLKINPAASCLHYGLQCFEGMKAYRSNEDKNSIHLFRPNKNMEVRGNIVRVAFLVLRKKFLLSSSIAFRLIYHKASF